MTGIFLLGISWNVLSQNPDKLISGPGSTLTENKCKICHELQHIRRTPLSRGEWGDNLRNMKERGTPMTATEQETILNYLAAYYSRDPAPPPTPDTLVSNENPIEKLLGAHACTGCHAVDRKVVGPSFRDVAAKYPPDSIDRLVRKVREGGQGAWGPVPMPPNPGIPEADAKTLVGWILGHR